MQVDFIKVLKARLQMLLEENRLASFKKWVFDDTVACSAQKLAEAGFYFTGGKSDPDSVECFLCEKSLDGWEPDDDPWEEHIKHSSNCAFAVLHQPEDALLYSQFIDIKYDLIQRFVNKCILNEEEFLKAMVADRTKILKSLK